MTQSLFEQIAFDREIVQNQDRLLDDELPMLPIFRLDGEEPPYPFKGFLQRSRFRERERNRIEHLQAQKGKL